MKSEFPTSVSAIICTRNRASSLKRTLLAMSAVDLDGVDDFELLIIDNGSADQTKDVAEAFVKTAPFRVEYLLEKTSGLSFARNRGLAAARGNLIMFTDDDCFVEPDWVKVAVGIFAGDLLRLVGGRVELFNKDHLSLVTKTLPTRETMASLGQLFGFLHGANMAFGRAVMDRIGLFDVRLGAGTRLQAAEDIDFVCRAFINGVPVTYEPALIVHHDHGRSGDEEAYRMMRGYSIGAGAMLVKHLFAGRTDLLKPNYWDCLSALRGWRADRRNWRWPLSKIGLVNGAFKYLSLASWRNST